MLNQALTNYLVQTRKFTVLDRDFDEEEYPAALFYEIDDLFNIKHEVEKFEDTIQGISARLKQ